MKKQLFTIKLSYIFLLILPFSCVDDNEFEIPPLVVEEPEIDGDLVEIRSLLSLLDQESNNESQTTISFEDTKWFVSGYVVSDDSAGNFFEELFVQNQPENPNAGVRILIDDSPLYTSFEKGRKIYVKLKTLSLGIENGVPTLGILANNKIDKISRFSVNEVLFRSAETETITPKKIQIEKVEEIPLCTFIQLENVQFNRKQVRQNHVFTYAAEANDEFNGERSLEHCESGKKMILSSSTFCDFKALTLPTQKGEISGILTRNFFGETYNLKINTPEDVVFTDSARCDPAVLECMASAPAKTIFFEERFTQKSMDSLQKEGWITVNENEGKLLFKTGTFSGNGYLEISGFNAKEEDFKVWVISPEVELQTIVNAHVSFDIQASYDNGNILTPFITNSYTGDVRTTDWKQIDAIIPDGNPDGFGKFQNVDPVSISCLAGKVRIGFLYEGSDPTATTRYHIDNFKVLGD